MDWKTTAYLSLAACLIGGAVLLRWDGDDARPAANAHYPGLVAPLQHLAVEIPLEQVVVERDGRSAEPANFEAGRQLSPTFVPEAADPFSPVRMPPVPVREETVVENPFVTAAPAAGCDGLAASPGGDSDSSSGLITSASARIAARSTAFSSSRTFPGQS